MPRVDVRLVHSRWLAACAGLLLLSACQPLVLDPRGPVAHDEKVILLDSLAIMLVIIVPTMIATLAVAWWFRASNTRARHRPEWRFSGRIEVVVWSIPLMVVILLGGVTWIGSHQLDPARPLPARQPALEVQVVSLDWKWLFIYPARQVAAVNQLVVPAGVPVHFTLTSASVMNTFFVPQLGSMIYTMNGMATQLHLRADAPGRFRGLSGHFSGDGFPDMTFEVRAVPPAEFDRWIDATQRSGAVLDGPRYAALSRQSIADAPSTFRAVEAGLFEHIVQQHLLPGPGPQAGRGGDPHRERP